MTLMDKILTINQTNRNYPTYSLLHHPSHYLIYLYNLFAMFSSSLNQFVVMKLSWSSLIIILKSTTMSRWRSSLSSRVACSVNTVIIKKFRGDAYVKVQGQKAVVQLNLFASCSPYEACDEEGPHSCCPTDEGHANVAFSCYTLVYELPKRLGLQIRGLFLYE